MLKIILVDSSAAKGNLLIHKLARPTLVHEGCCSVAQKQNSEVKFAKLPAG